uniref:Secreted protein n=1 Tax=Triticum urartu TaxID=4572 RepID=A0A8R7R535_TRIUA
MPASSPSSSSCRAALLLCLFPVLPCTSSHLSLPCIHRDPGTLPARGKTPPQLDRCAAPSPALLPSVLTPPPPRLFRIRCDAGASLACRDPRRRWHAERRRPSWIDALLHRMLSRRPSSSRIDHAGSRRCQILAWPPAERSSAFVPLTVKGGRNDGAMHVLAPMWCVLSHRLA